MLLDEVKQLFVENNISFELVEYENEKEYWHHLTLFPHTENAKFCKVKALVVKSNNKSKNAELQFNEINAVFLFEELRFGDYCFEFFDADEDFLTTELISAVKELQEGNLVVIAVNNLKKRRFVGDAIFDLTDDDVSFGKVGYEKAMLWIHKPRNFGDKLFKPIIQYEVYDWNSYQCIIK